MNEKNQTEIFDDSYLNNKEFDESIKNFYPYWPEINDSWNRSLSNDTKSPLFLHTNIQIKTTIRIENDGTWFIARIKLDKIYGPQSQYRHQAIRDFLELVYHTQLLFNPAAIHELKNMDGDSVWVKDHLQISEIERVSNNIMNKFQK